LGIQLDMPPGKLKTGHGDGVCSVLTKLCQVSLTNKFKFKKPIIKEEGGALDEEGDDMGDDMEGGADIADMANQDISEDEMDDFGAGGADKQ
jgi:hypothetical protein